MTGYHALLLAAGRGSRFGGRKLLAPWRGEPLIQASARRALAAPVDACIAVTGCDAEAVEDALLELDQERLRTQRVPNWVEGVSASLRAGLRALPETSRGVVVFLGDMPLVPWDSAVRLIDALAAGAAAAEVFRDGLPAHPVAYGRELFPELAALRGDRGGRSLLAKRSDVARFETDDLGATFDVDYPADLGMGLGLASI